MYEDGMRQNRSRKRKKHRGRFFIALLLLTAGCLFFHLWNGVGGMESGRDEWISSENVQLDQIAQLRSMVPDYPELSAVIANSSQYPAELVDLFLKNQETISYLIHYPARGDSQKADVKKEVEKGIIPLFIQWDERWGYESYGSGLIGWTGCGPTCLSMAVTGLTGHTKWTPDAVAKFSEKAGYYTSGAGTSWSLMSEGAEQLGVSSREISLSESGMQAELDRGNVIICSVGPGDFTTEGHYILIRGYDSSGFFVNDPNSRIRSGETWSFARLAPQIKNLWSVSA